MKIVDLHNKTTAEKLLLLEKNYALLVEELTKRTEPILSFFDETLIYERGEKVLFEIGQRILTFVALRTTQGETPTEQVNQSWGLITPTNTLYHHNIRMEYTHPSAPTPTVIFMSFTNNHGISYTKLTFNLYMSLLPRIVVASGGGIEFDRMYWIQSIEFSSTPGVFILKRVELPFSMEGFYYNESEISMSNIDNASFKDTVTIL